MPNRIRIGPFPAVCLTQPDGTEMIVRPDRVEAVVGARGGKTPTAEIFLTGGGQVTVRGSVADVLATLQGGGAVDLDSPITALRLSQRARLAVDSIGVRTVRDLTGKSPAEVQNGHLCGPRTLTEIREALATYGLSLAE